MVDCIVYKNTDWVRIFVVIFDTVKCIHGDIVGGALFTVMTSHLVNDSGIFGACARC